MGRRLQKLFILSDVHRPYHSKRGWRLAMDALKDFTPDIFINLGDYIDCFAVSNYSKDPARAMGLEGEMKDANKGLDEIEERLPKGCRRIYVSGNHEDRLQRYLQDKAPELLAFVSVPKLLRLDERKWEHVPYKASIQIGKLHITHDVGSAGRYNAFRALDTFQAPVITGHTHRLSYVVEGDATGGSQVSAQFGWLGDVEQVDYMHRVKARRDWTCGFGYGYVDKTSGFAYLVPVPVVDGTVVVEGRLYRAPAKVAA
ncbi:MAG: metallophosphoesterase [Sulfuricaulis sp.]